MDEKKIKALRETVGPYISDEFEEWLIEKGFFEAPASRRFHGAYEGGLFDHSFAVMKELLHLTSRLDLKWQKLRSPYIVGMFHDLCKIDSYVLKEKNPYGPHLEWEHNDESLIPGHGIKSIVYIQQFMPLTEEEMLCIRWHMGAFDRPEYWNTYERAIGRYPNVLYTHTADMIASYVEGL